MKKLISVLVIAGLLAGCGMLGKKNEEPLPVIQKDVAVFNPRFALLIQKTEEEYKKAMEAYAQAQKTGRKEDIALARMQLLKAEELYTDLEEPLAAELLLMMENRKKIKDAQIKLDMKVNKKNIADLRNNLIQIVKKKYLPPVKTNIDKVTAVYGKPKFVPAASENKMDTYIYKVLPRLEIRVTTQSDIVSFAWFEHLDLSDLPPGSDQKRNEIIDGDFENLAEKYPSVSFK